MHKVQTRSVQIESIKETMINDIKGIRCDEDLSAQAIKIRKDKEVSIKTCLCKLYKYMNY